MDKKYILMFVVIIAVITVGAYFLLGNNSPIETTTVSEHNTMVLSKSAYMEVPKSDNKTDKVNKKGMYYYKDKTYDINITSCSNLSTSSCEKEMKNIKDNVATGAKKSNENGIIIYEKNGTYSTFVKNTEYNDTLLIQSSDLSLLLQCRESVKYHDPTQKIKFDNDTSSSGSGSVIDVSKKTETAVQSSSQSSSSSSDSSSSWGYEWRSSGSSSSSSRSSGSVGGSASSSDLFDYD